MCGGGGGNHLHGPGHTTCRASVVVNHPGEARKLARFPQLLQDSEKVAIIDQKGLETVLTVRIQIEGTRQPTFSGSKRDRLEAAAAGRDIFRERIGARALLRQGTLTKSLLVTKARTVPTLPIRKG